MQRFDTKRESKHMKPESKKKQRNLKHKIQQKTSPTFQRKKVQQLSNLRIRSKQL
jgi:hypothetical protein